MRAGAAVACRLLASAGSAPAQVVAPLSFGVKSAATPPLIPQSTGFALANELSGSNAKRNVEYLAEDDAERDDAARGLAARSSRTAGARGGGDIYARVSRVGARGTGADYAYEVLNFVDGKRSAREIQDEVSAEFGPVSLDLFAEYLKALQAAGMVNVVK